MINLVPLLLFLNLSLTNLGSFISSNVKDKLAHYTIAPSLYERSVVNYEPKNYEDFKKFLIFFCNVKIIESGGYTIFDDNREEQND